MYTRELASTRSVAAIHDGMYCSRVEGCEPTRRGGVKLHGMAERYLPEDPSGSRII
jgi:hypothetical protein